MEMVTFILCMVVFRLWKKRNQEIMFPDSNIVKSSGGPSKRTRQNLKKKLVKSTGAPISTMADIIQSIADARKDLVQIIKVIVLLSNHWSASLLLGLFYQFCCFLFVISSFKLFYIRFQILVKPGFVLFMFLGFRFQVLV